MSAAKAQTSRSARNAMIAKVKIGQKQLGWDDDIYRGVLRDLYSQDSATKLQDHQLDDLISHMKRCGFKPVAKSRKKPARRMAESDLAKKIRALWISLYHLGEVKDSSEAALLTFAQRITKTETPDKAGIQALQWITAEQAWQVIEALKRWSVRAGVGWNHPYGPRAAVVDAQWKKIKSLRGCIARIGEFNELICEVTGKMSLAYCSAEDLDRLIKAFGDQIREAQDVKKS
jgi:phage gp16-like protein